MLRRHVSRIGETSKGAVRLIVFIVGVTGLVLPALDHVSAQTAHAPTEPSSLKGVLPILGDVNDYIADLDAARQLGKAFFWDTQAGSDGTACASCHFHAGADIRTRNQVSPGLGADSVFDLKASGGQGGPNAQLQTADFPFHRLRDPGNRESKVVFDTNDVASSMGAFAGDFVSSRRSALQSVLALLPLASQEAAAATPVSPGLLSTSDACQLAYEPIDASRQHGSPFHANGLVYRKVEPRQTPSVINAVFNARQYWDGRANNEFNGVDPFGPRTFVPVFGLDDVAYGNPAAAGTGILVVDVAARAGATTGPRSVVSLVQPLISNASLASQAVGPPLSDYDMSCGHKTFADLGRRLLPLRALSTQVVDVNDSLFGKTPGLVNRIALPGLNITYEALIKKAFKPKYWVAPGSFLTNPQTGAITASPTQGFTQIEHNFSLFWGLAIQAYESLLISDDAPFDRGDAALSAGALRGKSIFVGRGKCVACHDGPLFSAATITRSAAADRQAMDGAVLGNGEPALYDTGFYNTGVRPTNEDPGLGGADPYNFDLSFARAYKWQLLARRNLAPDHFRADPCLFSTPMVSPCQAAPLYAKPSNAPRDGVDGAFKAPTLRNVGLNPPYFHNGGQATLKDVVRFYNRGGDRRGPLDDDTTGSSLPTPFGQVNSSNLAADVGDASNLSSNNGLGLSEAEMDDLVEFLLSLTDKRVACHSGIFDHPSLPLVIAHRDVEKGGTQRARDVVATLPAVGQRGLSTCFPNTGDLFGDLQAAFNFIVR